MKMTDIGPLDEVFTHIDDATGAQTTYAAAALYRRAVQGGDGIETVKIPVEEQHAMFCVNQRGVEPERVVELLNHPEWLAKPILFIVMPDETHLLVDGTHRYVAAFAVQAPEVNAYLVPWTVAKDFIIEDVPQTPEEELMAHSHLVALRKMFGPGMSES